MQPAKSESTPSVSKASVLTVANIYWRPADIGKPKLTTVRYKLDAESSQEPYQRTMRIGPGWEPFDVGWVKEVGRVVLSNLGMLPIEVGVDGAVVATVLPGGHADIPMPVGLAVRGPGKLEITVFAR
jgi:hypothetical protein